MEQSAKCVHLLLSCISLCVHNLVFDGISTRLKIKRVRKNRLIEIKLPVKRILSILKEKYGCKRLLSDDAYVHSTR